MMTVDLFDALSERAPPRYTAFELPPYRFVPGVHPHPTTDPRGHSYLCAPRCEATALDGSKWWECAGYLYGCDLYNRGFWWEAHEAWEAIWHLAGYRSPERAALQGLIQLANCHLKLYMGLANAVSRLQKNCDNHFRRVVEWTGPDFLGLEFEALRAATNGYVRNDNEPVHDPGTFPFLTLPLDKEGREAPERLGAGK